MKRLILIFVISMLAYSVANAQAAVSSSTGTATTSVTTPVIVPNESEITFKSLVYDFGTVQMGADGKCNFIFTNTGREPLSVKEVKPSCGCTVPKWPKDEIAPGKSDTIKVFYSKMSIPPHSFEKTIAVNSNAKNGQIILTLKGTTIDSTGKVAPLPPEIKK